MKQYQLILQMHSYWHCGSGRGGGSTVDAVVHKDTYQIPEVPGRTVKGLLRDAVHRAECWGHLPEGSTVMLFGSDSRNFKIPPGVELADDHKDQIDRHQSDPGLLVIDNAVIDPQVAAWLRQTSSNDEQQVGAVQELYRHLYATAINPQTGAAQDGSLRGMEVVIPLELFAPISIRPGAEHQAEPDSWAALLEPCLPLIRGLGLARNRGLGRCQVKLEVCP